MNAARLWRYKFIADALYGLEHFVDLSIDEKFNRKLKALVRDDLRKEYEELRRQDAEEEAALSAAPVAGAGGST